ncbi:MAG: hypothetical protein M3041_12150 [Acidobacteriota bacterium]|nr:hypothetical protein [Acidobacteriota bacterium]
MPDDIRLTVEIKNEDPVALDDFVKSFRGLADEFELFVQTRDTVSVPRSEEVQLYVQEIRSGSIIAVLHAMAPLAAGAVLPLLQDSNTIIQFGGYLKSAYEYLTGKRKEKPAEVVTKLELENFAKIVEPVAKDNASQMNVNTTINGNVYQSFTINWTEANAAQNKVRRDIEEMKEPVTGMHDKVAMYFEQAKADPASTTGDRAVIESISSRPVKVVFRSEAVKAGALLATENPFTRVFVADVVVETVHGKPALYKVTEIHESFDKPS